MRSKAIKNIGQARYNNISRQKEFAKYPTLSTKEEKDAITKALKEGKGKRYPAGTTLNPLWKDDVVCQSLLMQATTIEIKDG